MTKKFRVWSKSKNRFLSGILITEDGLVCHIEKYEEFSLPKNQDDFTIQQWTGLTDSQGVEIYEGDILEFLGPEDFSAHYGKVFFEDGMFKATEHGTLYSWRKWITVVGDILQNPELLEKS